MLLVLALGAALPAPPPPEETILVTASREPVEADDTAVAAAVVERRPGVGEAAGLPLAADVVRLTAGASVSASGPRGSQTQVRLRGAEANHTLLVVDGIRFNDPAAGNEARFELLAGDLLERIEIVRGPQSALWGSEAIGGVVAAETRDLRFSGSGLGALAEYGSLDSTRGSAWAAGQAGKLRLSGTAAYLSSSGIDSFGAGGERDGFIHRSASLKAVFTPADPVEAGAVGHLIEGKSEFDGLDPATFRRADTHDETKNRIRAGRLWATADLDGWTVRLDGSLLASANRNFLGRAPLNRTLGRRFTTSAQLSKETGGHRMTAAAEHHRENFSARDQLYFGATDQNRSRDLTALVGEWRAQWHEAVITELAVRHDRFSAFVDATTLRAGATIEPARRVAIVLGYGEGIAQPTFYDLYGFFPGSFAGNPSLRPERSKSWHFGLRYGEPGALSVGITAFAADLKDEIVDVFDPATFVSSTANAAGISRRRGIEAEASFSVVGADFLANYTFLDAEERQTAGGSAVREVRRPRHGANLAGWGRLGAVGWGASLSYVGKRRDVDFDFFPARSVSLDDYVLASVQLSWRVSRAVEAFARAENAFDADYQDVVGYRTAGRTLHAGLRLRLDD